MSGYGGGNKNNAADLTTPVVQVACTKEGQTMVGKCLHEKYWVQK